MLGGCWPFLVPPAPFPTPTGTASLPAPSPAGTAPVTDVFSIVGQTPHDRGAWTEGLAFNDGTLYESTGLLGHSSLRQVDLASGAVIRRRDLSATDYGEGLAFLDAQAWVLTWTQQHVLQFDPQTFAPRGELGYEGQGWGLTTDGTQLFMSDGTNRITVRSPDGFRVLRWIDVADGGQPVARLNELEWVDGQIWANVWLTPQVVVIDPADGKVVERIDFSRLLHMEQSLGKPSEMNGIAWLAPERRLFVTGKNWGNLYEVSVPSLEP